MINRPSTAPQPPIHYDQYTKKKEEELTEVNYEASSVCVWRQYYIDADYK
jgi:hypothetical protein